MAYESTVKMRFKIDGEWQEREVDPILEFPWQGLNFVLHKNVTDKPKYRVSHRESGMLIWEGDKSEQTRQIAVGLMERAGKGGVAKSILKELGI
jgi:hypothetical protein